jgi:hypothetical protein
MPEDEAELTQPAPEGTDQVAVLLEGDIEVLGRMPWSSNATYLVAVHRDGIEARAIYNGWHLDPQAPGEHKGLIYRAPVIEVSRNPYWGRIHEVYSEDTFLTGRMGVAYVQGLQGDDARYLKLAATLKHFVVNNVEGGRTKLDALVPERWLREVAGEKRLHRHLRVLEEGVPERF